MNLVFFLLRKNPLVLGNLHFYIIFTFCFIISTFILFYFRTTWTFIKLGDFLKSQLYH